jgi:GTP-binding protein EngB required for normal cell division
MILICRSKTKYQIVLTKTDTVFPIDVARRAMQIEEVMNIGPPCLSFFSSYSLEN